ncbi:phosphoribosyl-dephospho-CoA transferase MdcG domain-containing protein [Klebsiella pneumoniae]
MRYCARHNRWTARRCWNGRPGWPEFPNARADTQVETPYGAFALNEWLRDGRALLKTSRGARLTATPWHREE